MSSTYCFGMDAPKRFPTPPERSTTLTLPSGTAAAATWGWRVGRGVARIDVKVFGAKLDVVEGVAGERIAGKRIAVGVKHAIIVLD